MTSTQSRNVGVQIHQSSEVRKVIFDKKLIYMTTESTLTVTDEVSEIPPQILSPFTQEAQVHSKCHTLFSPSQIITGQARSLWV